MKEKPKLLFVDDESDIVSSMRRLFRKDYDVTTATSGAEGVELIKTHPYDLIISDQRMPGMTGDELLKFAKEQQPDAIRILLTGYADMESLVKCVNDVGIYQYISKPWEPEALRQTVGQALANRPPHRESDHFSEQLKKGYIGKYELIKEIGKGATSTVYLARDPFADRHVAIKLLNFEGLEAKERQHGKKLFMTEASLAGKIEHPYIVSIYDAVITDEACYSVMEYVGGGTLERYCQVDNLLPPSKVIEIIFKCCHALSYAHKNGIIHCDIKPENILIVEGTDIKISDFGAAIVKNGDSSETIQIAGVGSLAYMSPQQAQGIELTPQADIYSLGVMFYKMLTGALPFTATDDASLLFQIMHIDASCPSTYRMDVPGLINDIVMKSLAKNVEDRYQNWEEFEQDLTYASDQLPKEVSNFTDTEKFDTLLKLDFFKSFGENELWEVLHLSQWAYYPEGTTIIREGDETDSFFIIISGEVEIRKNGRAISTVHAGECIGEMAGIRKEFRRRSASVVAHSDIKLVKIYNQTLGQASETCQRYFEKVFLELLANRLAEVSEQIHQKAKIKLSDAAPTVEPEVVLQEGCSCLELRRAKAFTYALIGFFALAMLLNFLCSNSRCC